MNLKALERRVDHRTPTYLPITFQMDDQGEFVPAHLVDFSATGAGLLTTERNAPALGQFIDLNFDLGDHEDRSLYRNETGLVVNVASPQRGVSRLGIKFLSRSDLRPGAGDPQKLMSSKRPIRGLVPSINQWQTARSYRTAREATRTPVGVL